MKVTVLAETCQKPITMIGKMAGICYGSNTTDPQRNYKRGINCLKSEHGRTWEFPDAYLILEGSARVLREVYTHIIGVTRLQASTRYINYEDFDYYIPPKIGHDDNALAIYDDAMANINRSLVRLQNLGIPKEDSANLLPMAYTSKMVLKINVRALIHMANVRTCNRAYHEFRALFIEISDALGEYSQEWQTLVYMMFKAKCEVSGYCTEEYGCGWYPKKEEKEKR